MDPRTLSSILVVLIAGSLFGFSIGLIAPMETFYSRLSNCSEISKELCHWVSSEGTQGCEWETNGVNGSSGHCRFRVGDTPCDIHRSDDTCKKLDYCSWNYAEKSCIHKSGFTAIENGLLATMMILGAFLMSLFSGKVVDRLGLKPALAVASAIYAVSAVIQIGGWAAPSFSARFALLLVARFISGIGLGISTSVGPMYVGDVAPKEQAPMIGVCFQIFVTLGIFIAALLGLVLQPPSHGGATKGDMDKYQVINAVNLAVALIQGWLAWYLVSPEKAREMEEDANTASESAVNSHRQAAEDEGLLEKDEANNADGAAGGVSIWMQPKWLLTALTLGGVLQLSGINAVMNFAPSMAKDVGLSSAMLANTLIMLWNFITTVAAIPLSKRLNVKWSFLGGGVIAGVGCFVVGIAAFPGVCSESVRNGLASAGLLFFIGVFELAIGPSFYVVASTAFPKSIRSDGCGLSLASNFVFNAIINFVFPVAVEALSGGPSGNQSKGLSIMFFIFAGCSIGLTGLLYILIRESLAADEAARKHDGELSTNPSTLESPGAPTGNYGATTAADTSAPKL